MTVFVDNIRFVTVFCGECGVPFEAVIAAVNAVGKAA